ncbi:primosomal protein N' [Bifidobacterium thermophilum]|uniref:primosomal protein N' n=1 Tax=Bifidobacterium thermophilum TaxID=33905 RepID=UPI0030B1573C
MTMPDAEQPAFDGLEPRRRRKRTAAKRQRAQHRPIARVVLDVQAAHLGQTFDYLVQDSQDTQAVPGTLVRVRFGNRRVNGIIWERTDRSDTPDSSLRYLERVLGGEILVPPQLRNDITLIAKAYGGTRANIVRLAVPPRVAWVEKEQRLAVSFGTDAGMRQALSAQRSAELGSLLLPDYENLRLLSDTLSSGGKGAFVVDAMPGAGHWVELFAWMVLSALAAGRGVVAVMPSMRAVDDAVRQLRSQGLSVFGPSNSQHGGYTGDIAVLGASMAPAERYRSYLAVACGQVRCVIGTRAAMYAPMDGNALFIIVDDTAYQQADGMMPYANARGVLRLRARAHDGVFVALGNARSPLSQWETDSGHTGESPVSGYSTSIQPLQAALKNQLPWVRWLNREELARLADPTIGSRVPHTAVAILSRALKTGPVLLSIPQDGIAQTLSCAACHRQARCTRCTGPLEMVPGVSQPRCRWCAAAAVNWTCPHCHGERMRVVRVGAAGTVQELHGLFRNVPMVVSSPHQPRGVIADIADAPMLVVSTPGAEPRVRSDGGGVGAYRAVAILDAWTSLYAPGIDARIDALDSWMRVVQWCVPRSAGGQALLIGEADTQVAQALMTWNARLLATKELEERAQTGLPPAFASACVWGSRPAVRAMLRGAGLLAGGDWALLDTAFGPMPAVLGPVPIPPPRTVDARELETMADRVKAVVRVPQSKRAELAERLHRESARHVASREPGELRFQLDPKDLI